MFPRQPFLVEYYTKKNYIYQLKLPQPDKSNPAAKPKGVKKFDKLKFARSNFGKITQVANSSTPRDYPYINALQFAKFDSFKCVRVSPIHCN